MKITVGVVAYNEEKNLPPLLKDIEGQSYPHSEMEVVLPGRVPFDNIRSHTSGHVFSLRQRIHIFFHKVFRDAAMGIDADQCLCRKGINDCIPATALYLPLIFYNFYIKKEIPIFFLPFLHHFPCQRARKTLKKKQNNHIIE